MRLAPALLLLSLSACRTSPDAPATAPNGVSASAADTGAADAGAASPGTGPADPLPVPFVRLAAADAAALGQQCSRIPYVPTRGFHASEGDLARLAADLPTLPQAYAVGVYDVTRAPAGFDPAASVMQVVGMELPDGRRRLYVNGFPSFARSCAEHSEMPCVVCDGGPDFWGVLYDPKTRAFDTLAFNGSA